MSAYLISIDDAAAPYAAFTDEHWVVFAAPAEFVGHMDAADARIVDQRATATYYARRGEP